MSDQVLLPVFLKLGGRSVLLVGGGGVAAARLGELTRAGAYVTVVAPEIQPAILSFDGVIVLQRKFVPSGSRRCLVRGGRGDARCQSPGRGGRGGAPPVRERGRRRRRAPAPTGGRLRRGGVTIAVSTEGRAPALAGLLREGLEAVLPEDRRAHG